MPNNIDDAQEVPKSIAIIMDGNRRWAKEQRLTTFEGHKAGVGRIKDVVEWALEAGVSELTFYVFSTENWNRAAEEVSGLMGLIEFAFGNWINEVIDKNLRIRVVGERNRFSKSIQEKIKLAEEKSMNGTRGTLVLALSYGGRAEILNAVNLLLASGAPSSHEITETEFKDKLWTAGLSDPDIILRTGGEQRLSNFLPWQSTYSELFFTDTKWPAFTKEELSSILAEYSQRERRHGK
jgi:undecaprenyl diphosphate synthase